MITKILLIIVLLVICIVSAAYLLKSIVNRNISWRTAIEYVTILYSIGFIGLVVIALACNIIMWIFS